LSRGTAKGDGREGVAKGKPLWENQKLGYLLTWVGQNKGEKVPLTKKPVDSEDIPRMHGNSAGKKKQLEEVQTYVAVLQGRVRYSQKKETEVTK